MAWFMHTRAGGPFRLLAHLLIAGASSVAAYWSARLAWADILSRGAPAVREHACKLDPTNPRLLERWAESLRAAGLDDEPIMERVAALEPWNAEPRIRLALAREMRGETGRAERDLLDAARLSRLLAPRWALANFYFRRGDQERFWSAARDCLEISSAPPVEVFALCRSAGAGAEMVLERAMPRRPEFERAYLAWLLNEGGNDDAAGLRAVARRVAATADAGGAAVLLPYCTREIRNGSSEAALEVWNILAARGAIPYATLDPGRGLCLTNGNFAHAPLNGGFDWRMTAQTGVHAACEPGRGMEVAFSGRQAERVTVAAQFLPVSPPARYRLRYRYEAHGLARGAGLRWRASAAGTGAGPWRAEADLGGEGPREESLEFRAPAGASIVELALEYIRAPGTTRTEGSVCIREVALESVP